MKPFSRFWVLLSLLLVVSSWMLGINYLDLYDWDELNFAEIAREMLVSGDWLHPTVNYEPFHEKPPLFTWMQLHCFRLFGPGPFAARFPNIICGLVSALVLYFFAKKHTNEKLALRWPAFFLLSAGPASGIHGGRLFSQKRLGQQFVSRPGRYDEGASSWLDRRTLLAGSPVLQ